jgi:glycolate oxidase FAD binding subunit
MGTHSSPGAQISGTAISAPHNLIADMESVWGALRTLVSEEHMHASSAEDAVDGMLPWMVIEPGSGEEVAAALKIAKGAGLAVIPRGGATKLDWGNPRRRGELILSTRRLNRIVEHAWGDMTATVEAGCTFQELQQTLSQHGQRLALDPLWPKQATIGGILATNDSGSLRVRFGSLRDLIIGVTLALPDGTLAKSGGKVVKNVAGYDLPKLATGSLGTLGVVTQAIFRLHPTPRESRTLSFSCPDHQTMNAVMLAIQDCNLVPTGVQARAAYNLPPEIDLRFEGTAAGCEAQLEQTLGMASGVRRIESPPELWDACSVLWNGAETSVVCKFTILPADLGIYIDQIRKELEPRGLRWRLVAQAVGAGYLRLEVADYKILPDVLEPMRKQFESRGGSLVILRCPREMKSKIDVWGNTGDALPLMKSIKAQFDPTAMLNPGRFVGGI